MAYKRVELPLEQLERANAFAKLINFQKPPIILLYHLLQVQIGQADRIAIDFVFCESAARTHLLLHLLLAAFLVQKCARVIL